jgi:hypothetical protein
MPKVQCPFDTCRSSTRPWLIIPVNTEMTIGPVSGPRWGTGPRIQAKGLRRAQTASWSLVLDL